jgi:hypothetical protein
MNLFARGCEPIFQKNLTQIKSFKVMLCLGKKNRPQGGRLFSQILQVYCAGAAGAAGATGAAG